MRNTRGAGCIRNPLLKMKDSEPPQFMFGSTQLQLSHHMMFCPVSVIDVAPVRILVVKLVGTFHETEISRRRTLSRLSV